MEGYTGTAPASPAWQAGIIANILIPQYTPTSNISSIGPFHVREFTSLSMFTACGLMLRATFETGMRMLGRASLGHMHKLSHGLAEVREEN